MKSEKLSVRKKITWKKEMSLSVASLMTLRFVNAAVHREKEIDAGGGHKGDRSILRATAS